MRLRSYLYVPGSRAELFEKALASDADAVVLDLEDAVAPDRKEEARATVAELLREEPAKPVLVRVNSLGSGLAEADLAAIADARLAGIRVPKVESPDQVRRVAAACECGIWCLLESALGLERAYEIATADERVRGVAIGEQDIRASLRVRGDAGLEWARQRVVVASRAAGIDSPVQSVYIDLRDEEGLRASCARGRDLGFFGRSALHPSQVAAINEAYTPTDEEIAAARELVEAMDASAAAGTGAFVLPNGRFVDAAVVESARETLAVVGA